MRVAGPVCQSQRCILLIGLTGFIASATVAQGATLTVCSAGCGFSNFQAALDAALPGDTILLRAGETFVGNFVLPTKADTTGPSILIRSDAPDSSLPSADTRLVPQGFAGGNTALGSLARLRGTGGIWKTTPVLQTAPGAHHYRIQFLDIDGVAQEGWETIVEFGHNGPEQNTLDQIPYQVVLDRVFVHGHPVKGQKRCLSLNGRDLEVRNSYIAGCASFAVDSQAIAGFNGPGPIRIINNYLEASTENVMFGGADPRIQGLVPADIEIRRNLFSKPISWRDPILRAPGAPSVSVSAGAGSLQPGTQYFRIVAVLQSGGETGVSAPSAERAVSIGAANSAAVLTWQAVPGADRYRVYAGTWSGGQNRYVETADNNSTFIYRGGGEIGGVPPAEGTRWNVKNLLELKNAQRVVIDGNVFEQLWPANQSGYAILFTPRNDDGRAPWVVVRDVQFSNNIVRHVSGGINILGRDDIHGSEQTGRITIRNNLAFDLSAQWGGASHFLLMTGSPFDVKVDHNTVSHEGMFVLIDAGASSGFEFTNNVGPHNQYGVFGSGAGSGVGALAAYFPDAVFTRNALGGGPASLYPPGNFFPDLSTFLAQFVNAAAQDFRLTPTSTFRLAGTDGKDLGVDFNALNAAQGNAGTNDGSADVPVGGGSGGSGAGSTPIGGTPIALPGRIQAENFDNGGAGNAYVDTTTGNSGEQYRDTDVDIEPTTDSGGGYNVGWAFAGEWLKYSVSVAAAGSYDIDIRVASAGPGGTFHIEVDNVDKTGPLSIPNTGGWQIWTTVRRSAVALAAGPHVLRLVLDANGGSGAVGNFNDIQVMASSTGAVSTPFGGTATALPGTVQAENFDVGAEGVAFHDLSAANDGGGLRNTGVDIEPALDAGGGYDVGWMFAGEWLNYTVNVTAAGTYDLEARVASNGPGGTFHIEVNGVDLTGPLAIPDTGGWQVWTTIRKAGVTLTAGQQVWRLVMDTNGPTTAVGNINFIRVVSGGGVVSAASDIVLYSSDVASMSGNWNRLTSTTGAGSLKMQSSDAGWSSTGGPLAAPGDYFEARFVPQAQRAYRVWVRLRAAGDSKFNDSVWVQFSGAIDANGAPLWQVGSASALLVNLEACAGCGVAGWGWQNGAWWLAQDTIVRFPSASLQTIRVQTREDGVDIDQIVLSPVTYFDRAPGSPTRDSTVVPKQ